MVIFNSFLYVYQRVSYLDRDFSWITNPICSSLPVETGVNASRRAAASRMALEGGASAIAVQGEMVRFFPPEHGNLHGKMRSETSNPWILGVLSFSLRVSVYVKWLSLHIPKNGSAVRNIDGY